MILGDNPGQSAVRGALPRQLDHRLRGQDIQLRAAGVEWVLRPYWIGEGFPADLQRFFDSPDGFAARGHGRNQGSIPVVAARRLSRGARQELDERGISWADLTGSARIEAEPGLFVYRMLPSVNREFAPVIRWSRSAGAVAETILHMTLVRRADIDVIDAFALSEFSGYSYAQVNKVLQEFESVGYIAKTGAERGTNARRRLIDPSRLLSDWAGWFRRRDLSVVEMNTVWRDVNESLEHLSMRASGPWAVSGWFAADAIAPFSTSVPSLATYIEPYAFENTVDSLIEQGGFGYATERGRFSIAQAERHVLRLSEPRAGTMLVSPIRVYGDLLRSGVRGEEAAEHLREAILVR